MLVARLRRLCDKLFIVSIFIKFQSPPNIYKRSVSNIDTNIGLGYTTAHWASTGGHIAYFKKKIFFFLISLVLSLPLILHLKSSLILKKLCLVEHIQQELSLTLKKATLVCCSVWYSAALSF